MGAGPQGFTAEEWQAFGDEAREHLEMLEGELLAFERGEMDGDALARAFRAAHTLKGASATLGLTHMAHLTHALESRLDELRQGARTMDGAVATAMLRATDALAGMLEAAVTRHEDADDAEATGALEALGPASDPCANPRNRARGAAPPEADGARTPYAAGVLDCAIDPASPMPAVRALQVWMEVERTGLGLRCAPSMADIEAERVHGAFCVWLSQEPPGELLRTLSRVPDVLSVEWRSQAEEGSPPPQAGRQAEGAPAGSPPGDGHSTMDVESGTAALRLRSGEAQHSVRVDVSLLDHLMNLVGELVTERNRLLRLGQELPEHHAQSLTQVTSQLARLTQSLQETVLKARMLPVDRLFRRFPRMVRDLSQQLGKELEFAVDGQDAELDRSVMDAIGDPLVHILRNAVDHGIEPPDLRVAAGKSRSGVVRLAARQEEGHVLIEVEDDGAGLHPEKLRQVAVSRGLLTGGQATGLSDQAALELIFLPGFSTASQVSEVSGRGVGMDVVRRNVEAVGGHVEIASSVGRGTRFTMWLPLTLATVRVLMVEVGPQTVALPLSSVTEALRIHRSGIQSAGGRPVILVRGRAVPLLSLARYLDRPARWDGDGLAVLVQVGREVYGLLVDRLLGEQEVVAKALPAFWPRTAGIGGVAILGDGRPALILDLGGVTKALTVKSA